MPTWRLLLPLALAACASGRVEVAAPAVDTGEPAAPAASVDPGDALWALDRVVQVDVELPPEDWDELRFESRNLVELLEGDCRAEPFGSPYTWFRAAVTLDGQRFDAVEVRKKGFIGSLSDERPSLKLDLGEFDDDLAFEGARRLTLNNAISDPSVVRQCLTYSAFADAGLAAPRCGFARVRVNGEDLGLYVNLEPVKEPFLERHWGDASGNLYEGTLSDFRPDLVGTLEPKNNEDESDRADVDALVAALDADDDALLAALDAHLDLDRFYTHWAMEVLTKHQDGYAANTNNFYIYADPADGRFDFIPWGTDDTLSPYWWEQGAVRESVFATGHLENRLYAHHAGQRRYLDRLTELLETTWQEPRLLARLDRMEAALVAELGDGGEAGVLSRNIDEVRRVVERRRSEIEDELADGPPRWRGGAAESWCMQQTGGFEVSLETTWGSLERDWMTYGDVDLVLTLEDESLPLETAGATAGWSEGAAAVLIGAEAADGRLLLLYLWLGEDDVAPGPVEVDLVHAGGGLYVLEPGDADFTYASELGGTLVFDAAEPRSGEPVVATMSGGFYSWTE